MTVWTDLYWDSERGSMTVCMDFYWKTNNTWLRDGLFEFLLGPNRNGSMTDCKNLYSDTTKSGSMTFCKDFYWYSNKTWLNDVLQGFVLGLKKNLAQ